MKFPRDVSGAQLASTLCRRWQYAKVHQVGSHISRKPEILKPAPIGARTAASPA